MADYTNYCLQDKNELKALGNAIRAKTGVSDTLTVPQMTNAVNNIEAGVVLTKPVIDDNTISLRWSIDPNADALKIYHATDTGLVLDKTATGSYGSIRYGATAGDVEYTILPRRYAARAVLNNGMGTDLSAFTSIQTNSLAIKNLSLHGKSNGRGIMVGLASTANLDQAYVDLSVYYTPNKGNSSSTTLRCYFMGETVEENGDTVWAFGGTWDGYCKITFNYIPSYPLNDTGADGTFEGVSYSSITYTMGYTNFRNVYIEFYKADGLYNFRSAWGDLQDKARNIRVSIYADKSYDYIGYNEHGSGYNHYHGDLERK